MKQYEDRERYANQPEYKDDRSLDNLDDWEFMTDRKEDEHDMRGLREGIPLQPERPEGIIINEMQCLSQKRYETKQ